MRKFDDAVRRRLKQLAAEHGRPMVPEVRSRLTAAVTRGDCARAWVKNTRQLRVGAEPPCSTPYELTLQNFFASMHALNEVAARRDSLLQETRRLASRPLAAEDGMNAATCLIRDAALATRNTTDFEGLGLATIDPWAAGR